MSVPLPGFGEKNAAPDLMILGEVLVKHYLYLSGREEKKDFLEEVYNRFYLSPATKFEDEMLAFKNVIQGNASFYNDALLFVMAVTSDLVVPELYFKKLLNDYRATIASIPDNRTLGVGIKESQYFECVYFALRFYVDQLDLISGDAFKPTEADPKESDKK